MSLVRPGGPPEVVADQPAGVRDAASSRTLARGGLVSMLGGVGSGVLQLVLVLVVTNGFSLEVAGVFFAATSLFVVVAAGASLGADTGLIKFLPQHVHDGRRDLAVAVLRSAAVPVVLVAVLLAALGAVSAPLLVGGGASAPPDAVVLVLLVSLVLPAAVVLDVACATTRAFGSMVPTVAVDRLGRPALQAAAVAAASAGGAGAWLLGAAWAAPFVVAAPVAVVLAAKAVRRHVPGSGGASREQGAADPATPSQARRVFWGFTGPRGVARLLQIALARIDVVVVALLLGPGDAAVYAAASRLLLLGTVGVVAVQQALQPQLSRLVASGQTEAVVRLFRQSTAWNVACSWPVFMVLGAASPVLVRLLGDGYEAAAAPLTLLCAAMLFATWAGPVDIVVLMAGRSRWSLGNAAVALATDVVLLFVLVPRMGILGAAAAWGAAIVVRNVLPLLQVRRLLGAGPSSRAGVLVAASSALLLGLPVAAVGLATGHSVTPTCVTVLLGGVGYLLVLVRLRHVLGLDAFRGALRGRRAGAGSTVAP